jgi:hypothetical protein
MVGVKFQTEEYNSHSGNTGPPTQNKAMPSQQQKLCDAVSDLASRLREKDQLLSTMKELLTRKDVELRSLRRDVTHLERENFYLVKANANLTSAVSRHPPQHPEADPIVNGNGTKNQSRHTSNRSNQPGVNVSVNGGHSPPLPREVTPPTRSINNHEERVNEASQRQEQVSPASEDYAQTHQRQEQLSQASLDYAQTHLYPDFKPGSISTGFTTKMGPKPMSERQSLTAANPTMKQALEQKWKGKYLRLVEFKKVHGHTKVPERCALGIWSEMQRKHFERLPHERNSPMTKERIAKLNNIGFDWTPNPIQAKTRQHPSKKRKLADGPIISPKTQAPVT